MTTYRMDGKLTRKFAKREEPEDADDINETILVRHSHGPTMQLRDPKDGKWRTYTNARITTDGYLFVDGDEPLPSFPEKMVAV